MKRVSWNYLAAAGALIAALGLSGCANADFASDTTPISRSEDVTPRPSLTPAPTAAPAKLNPLEDQFSAAERNEEEQVTGRTGITNSGVNVHASPKGETTDSLPNEAEVEILGRDGGWFLVRYQEIEGYIYGQFLDIDGVNALDLDEEEFADSDRNTDDEEEDEDEEMKASQD